MPLQPKVLSFQEEENVMPRHTHTQRKWPWGDGGRDWSHTAQAKKCLELLEAGKAKEGASPKTESQGARLPDILILHS